MSKRGKLNIEQFGFSMPVDAPLYPRPPVYYRDMETITVAYETDEDAALALLPYAEELELVYPVTARIVIARMPFTTYGAYDEAYQLLDCTWEGKPCIYPVRIILNNESAMAAGRELWGNPKKWGHVEWGSESELKQGLIERPKGSRIGTVLMKPERPVALDPYQFDVIGLRVIPSPELNARPSVAELVMNSCKVTPKQAWSGPGSVSFGILSELDPWHRLPVRKMKDAIYVVSDMDVAPSAVILKKY